MRLISRLLTCLLWWRLPAKSQRLRDVADEIISINLKSPPIFTIAAVCVLIGGGAVHAADVPPVKDGGAIGVDVSPQIVLMVAGVGLLLSWIGGKVDWKALLAKLPRPTPTTSAGVVKPAALSEVTTVDAKQAKDRLDVVLSKVDELAATRLWLQQTEDAVRKEIASVRSAADMMEARLNGQPSTAAETRS